MKHWVVEHIACWRATHKFSGMVILRFGNIPWSPKSSDLCTWVFFLNGSTSYLIIRSWTSQIGRIGDMRWLLLMVRWSPKRKPFLCEGWKTVFMRIDTTYLKLYFTNNNQFKWKVNTSIFVYLLNLKFQ